VSGERSPTPITDFLFRLEVDPELVKAFLDDPVEALKDTGIPSEAAEALRQGNLPRLQEFVDAEHPDEVSLLIRGWIKWVRVVT
jgi:hypothetical protein